MSPDEEGRRALDDGTPRTAVVHSNVSVAGQGIARSPSFRQNKPSRKPLNRSYTPVVPETQQGDEQEARTANMELIAELKEQVKRAEQASEQYRRQLEVLQHRLDEFTEEQTAAEEREYQRRSDLDLLRVELREAARHRREMEHSHETERSLFLQDRQNFANREGELQAVIQRLSEALRARESLRNSAANMLDNEPHFKQGPKDETDDGAMASAIQAKDAMIESLRIELVEAQIKVAEIEHIGDGRHHELERSLTDMKMTNARLREENESFQHLLSERTLKGHFLHDDSAPLPSAGLSSLAEELDAATDDGEEQPDAYRKIEAEARGLRESNKALTLYVDKIIGRLLQHEGFEHIITARDDPPELPVKPTWATGVEKALPAPPEPEQNPAATADPGPQRSGSSFLQRARSVIGRQTTSITGKPLQAAPSLPTANENPETAPSIPLNKGHRRARSDLTQKEVGAGAAAVIQQMNRGSPLRTVSGGPTSPGINPLSPQLEPIRGSYFPPGTASNTRATSATDSMNRDQGSSRNSVTSELSGKRDSTDATSATTSTHGSGNIPGAVMKQNQLRPLRLVKEQNDEQEQKRANRGSWMGWLKAPTTAAAQHE